MTATLYLKSIVGTCFLLSGMLKAYQPWLATVPLVAASGLDCRISLTLVEVLSINEVVAGILLVFWPATVPTRVLGAGLGIMLLIGQLLLGIFAPAVDCGCFGGVYI